MTIGDIATYFVVASILITLVFAFVGLVQTAPWWITAWLSTFIVAGVIMCVAHE